VSGHASVAVAPLLVALVTAVLTLFARSVPRLQRGLSVLGGVGYAVAVAALFAAVRGDADGYIVYTLSGWEAPFGIVLVADALSAFFLAIAAAVGLPAVVFSVWYLRGDGVGTYHPLFHFMLVGITGAFLTGDLFNLFVWFEVMLLASYVFVVFYGGGEHTRAALRYVVLNVVGSAVMLVAIGGLYATTGTLNMADMSRRLADPATFGVQVEPVVGLSALLLSVFALKAGLVPFQFWVPDAYRAAPLPVTALLAAGTKKVGIYALVRIYFTVLGGASVPISFPALAGETPLGFFGPVLFAMAVASIFVGGLGAVDAESIEGVFAYSSVGQIGFIAVPVAVGATASSPTLRHLGVLAGLVYALNHALAKGTLFLVAAAVRSAAGTSRFVDLGGVADRSPVASGAYLVGALALVGIPPLSGFVGKLLVFDVVVRDGAVLALGALLAGTLLTVAYTTRTWNRGFWGSTSPAVETATVDPVQAAVLVALAGTVLAVGVGFEPVYRFADAAATAALDRGAYVELVGPRGGGGA
jgi:multicomponent Na+:H+ antiporter subunit D